LSNSVISPAVVGFLTLFNARKMCSLRRRLEFGIFFIFIAGSTASEEIANSCGVCFGYRQRNEAGSGLVSTFRIAALFRRMPSGKKDHA
jgi:hypothetical protein